MATESTSSKPAPERASSGSSSQGAADTSGTAEERGTVEGARGGERGGPGAVETTVRRVLAGLAGLALVIGFFLPWRQATTLDPVSVTGFDVITKGLMAAGTRLAVGAVPLCGLALLAAAYVGRRASQLLSLVAGLALLLVGTWQVLSYLALSIGVGLWVVAGASLVAMLAGIPWRRMLRGAMN